MGEDGKTGFNKIFSLFMDYFGLGRTASIVGMIVVVLLIMTACFWFFHSAPRFFRIAETSRPSWKMNSTSAKMRSNIINPAKAFSTVICLSVWPVFSTGFWWCLCR
jgi:divalent metal cation (Fe/Co/Zn/Cd) transporter